MKEKFQEREFLFALAAKLQFLLPLFGFGSFHSDLELIVRGALAVAGVTAYIFQRTAYKAVDIASGTSMAIAQMNSGHFADICDHSKTVH